MSMTKEQLKQKACEAIDQNREDRSPGTFHLQ